MNRIAFCLICFVLCLQLHAQTQERIANDETSIRNLMVFARVYGAFHYFYPSKQVSKIDWERFIEKGIPKIAAAKTDEELVAALNNYCGSRDMYVSLANHPPNHISPGKGKFNYWRHIGFNAASDLPIKGLMGFLYRKWGPYRGNIISGEKVKNIPQPDSLYSYPLTDGITLHMRNALYKHEKLPPEYKALTKAFKKKKEDAGNKDNQNFRLATAIYACTILENFYPDPEMVSRDWNTLSQDILSKAVSDTSNVQFQNSLRRLFHELNDGHAGAILKGDSSTLYSPPLLFVLIDSNIVVRECEHCDSLGVSKGDILIEVDGKDALEVMRKEEQLWSGSTATYKSAVALLSFIEGSKNSTVELTFNTAQGTTKKCTLRRTHLDIRPSYQLPLDTVFDSNIKYLNWTASSKLASQTVLNLTAGQSLIVDFRGYPRMSSHFLGSLAKVNMMESLKWLTPVNTFPFQQKMVYDTSSWEIKQSKKTIPESCKVVFLTNYRAISKAETILNIVKYYKLGTIIGETTAATTGNAIFCGFGDTFLFAFTGMKVLNQDDSRFQGVGVKPDIEVKRTVEGVRAGRDEVLEYAIQYLKSN